VNVELTVNRVQHMVYLHVGLQPTTCYLLTTCRPKDPYPTSCNNN